MLNDTDKAYVTKTSEGNIKKLRKNGIAKLPSDNASVSLNVAKKGKKYYFAFSDGEIVGPLSNTFSEIEKRILSFVKYYRKQNKKLRINKQMRAKM